MIIREEIDETELVVAKLASAFTLLALVPYDGWNHEGDPAEMAVYVVATAKKNGNLGMVTDVILGRIQDRMKLGRKR